VYPYLAKIGFEIYISGNEGSGDSEYEFSLCICVVSLCIYKVYGLRDGGYNISLIVKSWGEVLHHHC